MKTVTLKIEGMSCGGCVQKVKTALGTLPGTRVEEVTVGSARFAIDPSTGSEKAALAALSKVGFNARLAEQPVNGTSSAGGGCCGR